MGAGRSWKLSSQLSERSQRVDSPSSPSTRGSQSSRRTTTNYSSRPRTTWGSQRPLFDQNSTFRLLSNLGLSASSRSTAASARTGRLVTPQVWSSRAATTERFGNGSQTCFRECKSRWRRRRFLSSARASPTCTSMRSSMTSLIFKRRSASEAASRFSRTRLTQISSRCTLPEGSRSRLGISTGSPPSSPAQPRPRQRPVQGVARHQQRPPSFCQARSGQSRWMSLTLSVWSHRYARCSPVARLHISTLRGAARSNAIRSLVPVTAWRTAALPSLQPQQA